MWMSLSGHSQCLEICTFSISFAKPGRIANTSLILALPSFHSLWLCTMSVLLFSPNCWLHSWASQHLVWPLTTRLLMYAPKASWMTCAMHGMWFFIAGHIILEGSRGDCSSRVIELIDEASSVVIPSKWLSVSSKQSRTSFKCMATLSSMSTHDLVISISTGYRRRTGYQPHRMQVVLLPIPNFDPYSKLWPMLSPICSSMSTHLMLS